MTATARVLRFAVVGVGVTLLDFVLLWVLVQAGVPKVLANIASTGVAFVVSFLANRNWTFQSQGRSRRETVRELVLFVVVTLFGLWVLQSLVIWLLSPVVAGTLSLGHDAAVMVAKLVATGVSTVWNWLMYSRVVFSAQPEGSPE